MRSERYENPGGCCPVDTMKRIADKEKGNVVVFNLTRKVLYDMLEFPVDKNVEYKFDDPKCIKIYVQWFPSKDEMKIHSCYEGNQVWKVVHANTEEIKCEDTEQADVEYLIY